MYSKNLVIRDLVLQSSVMSDYDSGGSDSESKLIDKVKARKSRRVPIVRFILLFAAIVLTIIVLEYFI